MMLYRMSFEFRLTRLAPWTDDGADFYGHVESVRAKIGTHEFVRDVRAITDMAESRLNVDFVIDACRHQIAFDEAMRIVSEAIENAGARHFGLGAAREGMFRGAGAKTGIDTPVWHRRRVLIDLAA